MFWEESWWNCWGTPAEFSQNSHVRCPVFQSGKMNWEDSLEKCPTEVQWILFHENFLCKKQLHWEMSCFFSRNTTFKRKNLHMLRKYNFFTNILSCLKGMLHTFGTLQENSSNSTCFLSGNMIGNSPPKGWNSLKFHQIRKNPRSSTNIHQFWMVNIYQYQY